MLKLLALLPLLFVSINCSDYDFEMNRSKNLSNDSKLTLQNPKATVAQIVYKTKISNSRVELGREGTNSVTQPIPGTEENCRATWDIMSFTFSIKKDELLLTATGDKSPRLTLKRLSGKKGSFYGTWIISESGQNKIWRVETLVIENDSFTRKTTCDKK